MSENGTALAVRDQELTDLAPRFVISMDELRQQVGQLEEFKRDIMIKGVDYGEIPGTPKPTLLKPGAEKLSMVFGLAPTFESANCIEDWERGFFHYDERCILTSKRTGFVAASANGSANSKEPRYRWRKAERVCPDCHHPAIIKGRAEFGGGWICFDKKGGCKAKFKDDDRRIVDQPTGNVENPEPYELVNTIKKMAQKRALVAAVLIATGGSGIWTQDIEDMPSVSNDPDIIDVTPEPAKPSNDAISDNNHPLWLRWLALKAEAEAIGVPVERLQPPGTSPISKTQLTSLGIALGNAISSKQQELAQQEAARIAASGASQSDVQPEAPASEDSPPQTSDAGRPADKVTKKTDPRWQDWLDAEKHARVAGVKIDTSGVKLGIDAESLQVSIDMLDQAIADATNGEDEAF